VIAQTAGDITLAGVKLPWWNVTTQRWEVAELPPRSLHVAPSIEAAGAAASPAVAEEPAVAPNPAAAREGSSYWPWVTAVFAAAWLATVALWWRAGTRRPRASSPAAATKTDAKPSVRKILRDLGSACAVSDPTAARNALLSYAEARFAPSSPRSLGALAALLAEPVAREVLALEAHIYGDAAGPWRGDGLKAVLGELESGAGAPERAAAEPLLPLYR
jgi:hypothetical protein